MSQQSGGKKKFNPKQWGVGNRQSDPPPDPHNKRLSCVVSGVKPRFVSADESFAIWSATMETEVKGKKKELNITVKGALARVNSGEMLDCQGRWRNHPKHGWSFEVEHYESALPQNAVGVAAWLEARVEGVGPTFAKAIVAHFGAQDVFKVLDADPTKLREVRSEKGRALPSKQVEKAIEAWDEAKAIRQIETFLFGHGVTAKRADQLYRHYGEEVIDIMQNTPYKITELRGIGFRVADKIAQNMGVAVDDPDRIEAAILFVLEEAESEGHVYLNLKQLMGATATALQMEETKETASPRSIVDGASRLTEKGKIKFEDDDRVEQRVYHRRWWETERRVARIIRELLSGAGHRLFPAPKLPQAPENASEEEITALKLPTDEQWELIDLVRENRLSILSGGPGVGKCIRGSTKVIVNNKLHKIEDIWAVESQNNLPRFDGEGYWVDVGNHLVVPAVSEKGEIISAAVNKIYRQKVNETGRRVMLADGRHLTMTQQHRLLTPDGWQKELNINDRVAIPNEKFSSVDYIKIIAIESVQLDEWVYDFEVPEYHNYVAGGICSHNTASVEWLMNITEKNEHKVHLCAPTGKAARRMQELTGHPASTIHKLLEFSPFEGGFQRDESNPLEGDLLIVDEASMLSLDLADSLLRAVPENMHVLFVGDNDQLPPVGAGKVFDDLIHAEAVPRVHLTKIFRQAAKSMIIQNSRRLNAGELPYLRKEEAEKSLKMEMLNDFFWINRAKPEDTLEMTIDMATSRIPRAFGFDARSEIMVLAPMRKGKVGLEALNKAMEEKLNPDPDGGLKKPIVPKRGISVGSRIVQTVNLYHPDGFEKSVMNGEVGMVLDYKESDKEALLSFDDGEREFWLPTSDMESFFLAWAITVHRSQGSQWPCIVCPVSTSHYAMLSRNLEYVAVTRAEKFCVMVGEKKALQMAVNNVDMQKRNSTLVMRISDPTLSGELF